MSTLRRIAAHPLLEPLSLAAWVAWGVVWITTVPYLDAPTSPWALVIHLALWGFLAGFVCIIGRQQAWPPWAAAGILALMAVAGLLVASERAAGTGPILLVLLASLLGHQLQGYRLWLALSMVNIGLAWALSSAWGLSAERLWISLAAYASFQVFAALVTSTARRSEEIAENLQAVNAELLTTRTLLAEAARDQERLALSRELHDVAGHSLTALKLNLGALGRDPRQPDPERIALCAGLADELLRNLRGVVQAMRVESGTAIEPALQRLAAPFPRPRLQLDIAESAAQLPAALFEAVLRAVQEALTNAARHGPARTLHVHLRREDGQLELELEDDGRATGAGGEGGGLSGMRERFEQLGGSLQGGRGQLGGMRLLARCPWPAA